MSETGQAILGMINAFLIFVWPVIWYKYGYAEGQEKAGEESRDQMRKTLMTTGCCPYCFHRHFDINQLTNQANEN